MYVCVRSRVSEHPKKSRFTRARFFASLWELSERLYLSLAAVADNRRVIPSLKINCIIHTYRERERKERIYMSEKNNFLKFWMIFNYSQISCLIFFYNICMCFFCIAMHITLHTCMYYNVYYIGHIPKFIVSTKNL